MALVVKDRVKETTTTTGTGAISLGGAVSKFVAFSSVLSNGDTAYYSIEHLGTANEFEVGIGTYTSSGNTLTRTTVLASSNSNNAVNFSSGTKEIFITYPADKAVYEDASGNIAIPGTIDGRDLATDGSKLDGIEASATADQTNAEIRAAVEAASDSNVFTDADHTKLNGIEASADVTDTANVTSAGALMDSEVTNLAEVKAFDSSDYATAAQGSTADAAMPKAGGTFTGTVTVGADGAGHNVKFFGGTSGEYVEWDASEDTLYFPDNSRLMFGGNGTAGDLRLYTNGTNAFVEAIQTTDLIIKNQQNDQDVTIQTDNGSGGSAAYFRADGSTGESILYHYGSEKLATKSTGIDVTGNITVSGTVDGKDVSTLTTAAEAADEATALAIALG